MLRIFIDADGCPVKDETYRVAARYGLKVILVANKPMKIPLDPLIEMVVVDSGFDAADDWIVETAEASDIVITGDILLAERCIKNKVRVVGHKGKEFTEENIGGAVGGRELMAHLRQIGEASGGPSSMAKPDRSRFLSTLDQVIQSIKRNAVTTKK